MTFKFTTLVIAACLTAIAMANPGSHFNSSRGSQVAQTVMIDFNGLSGANGSPFTSYAEYGFTVSPYNSSDWLNGLNYGDPAPYIYFHIPAGEKKRSTIFVEDGGATFTFNSIDLYSSVTPIPYTFRGSLNGTTVFTVTGKLPNTFGNFANVVNPRSTVIVDKLEISVTSPLLGCCDNDMGLDNISLTSTAK